MDNERSSIDDIIELYKRDVDRTLLREALQMTVAQRFERFVALMTFLEPLRESGRAARKRA